MSTTKKLIDKLKPYCGNWERSSGDLSILDLIQDAQDILFDYDGEQAKYLGTDNLGWAPYLTTVSGTYRYEITASNLTNISSLVRTIGSTDYPIRARKVVKVFVDATNIDYGKKWFGQPYAYSWQNPYSGDFSRLQIANIPVASYEATDAESATIEFREDPGDSTDKYFVVFSIEPPRLLSESVPLIIPITFEEAIKKYVLGNIQSLENGKDNEHLEGRRGFYSYWMPKFRQFLSSGAQSVNTKTHPRYC